MAEIRREAGDLGVPEKGEKGRERGEAEEAGPVFDGAERMGKEAKERIADGLFKGVRDLIGGLDGESAAALRPFLERAAASTDRVAVETAKEALLRLDLKDL